MKRVVFACVHNAGRSQMAAAWFNHLADVNHLANIQALQAEPQGARIEPTVRARAVSAGTSPADRVHPEVLDVMKEVGIDLSSARPQKLTAELAAQADLLVTMGCGDACPYVPGLQVEDWPLDDPQGQPMARVRVIRDEIRGQVEALLARSLARERA
ncbi:MAG: arsenate reductase ArsC [Acidobacteria bacterium]|nr:arsenate reductase ArsC [Acidobacteriota bacterium]